MRIVRLAAGDPPYCRRRSAVNRGSIRQASGIREEIGDDVALLLDNSDADVPYRFAAPFSGDRRRRKARRVPAWARQIAG
jgi:hypothetical protein